MGRHYVEPVVPPPEPRHIIAQQLLALCLQEAQVRSDHGPGHIGCFVEPADGGGKARWNSGSFGGVSYPLIQAVRDVLLGEDPPTKLTQRAAAALADARGTMLGTVHPSGTVITRTPTGDIRWWTWAGYQANMTSEPACHRSPTPNSKSLPPA